jgi:hypothetical protein
LVRRRWTALALSRRLRLVGNTGSPGLGGCFGLPVAQDRDGLRFQGREPPWAALAETGDVRSGPEVDVGPGQGGQLRQPQPGRDGQSKQGVVPPAGPGGAVRGGQEQGLLAGRQGPPLGCRAWRCARRASANHLSARVEPCRQLGVRQHQKLLVDSVTCSTRSFLADISN